MVKSQLTKLISYQPLLSEEPFPITIIVPEGKRKVCHEPPLYDELARPNSGRHPKSGRPNSGRHHGLKNNAKPQERYEKFENSTISTSPALEYPKKVYDLTLVTGIYDKAIERVSTEYNFLKELCNVLVRARFMMDHYSRKPVACPIYVKGLEGIYITEYDSEIQMITNQIDSLQQLMHQNICFSAKLYDATFNVKSVIRKYCNSGKDEFLFQHGYLATIETIESTSKEIQMFWSSYLQSPVVSKYLPNTESQRSQLFADDFFAIFNMVLSLNNGYQCLKGRNCPAPWSRHIVMGEMLEKFRSF